MTPSVQPYARSRFRAKRRGGTGRQHVNGQPEPRSVVIRGVAEAVVGVEQDLFDEATNVASSGGVDVLAAIAADGHEAGETQLGEMLTCRRGGGTSELGERSHVPFS